MAVIFQVVEGGPLVSVTLEMDAPVKPLWTRLKLLVVRPSIASAKVICQVTVAFLLGLELWRVIEVTVVLGRVTVTVSEQELLAVLFSAKTAFGST